MDCEGVVPLGTLVLLLEVVDELLHPHRVRLRQVPVLDEPPRHRVRSRVHVNGKGGKVVVLCVDERIDPVVLEEGQVIRSVVHRVRPADGVEPLALSSHVSALQRHRLSLLHHRPRVGRSACWPRLSRRHRLRWRGSRNGLHLRYRFGHRPCLARRRFGDRRWHRPRLCRGTRPRHYARRSCLGRFLRRRSRSGCLARRGFLGRCRLLRHRPASCQRHHQHRHPDHY